MTNHCKWLAAGVAALLVPAPTAAEAACSLRAIAGTWVLNVEALHKDTEGGFMDSQRGLCWMAIRTNRVVDIRCTQSDIDHLGYDPVYDGGDLVLGLFGAGYDRVLRPQHRIFRDSVAASETIDGIDFPTPRRCQWRIHDPLENDVDYIVNFSPSLETLQGYGTGHTDEHYGSTEPFTAQFTGVRQ